MSPNTIPMVMSNPANVTLLNDDWDFVSDISTFILKLLKKGRAKLLKDILFYSFLTNFPVELFNLLRLEKLFILSGGY